MSRTLPERRPAIAATSSSAASRAARTVTACRACEPAARGRLVLPGGFPHHPMLGQTYVSGTQRGVRNPTLDDLVQHAHGLTLRPTNQVATLSDRFEALATTTRTPLVPDTKKLVRSPYSRWLLTRGDLVLGPEPPRSARRSVLRDRCRPTLCFGVIPGSKSDPSRVGRRGTASVVILHRIRTRHRRRG